MADSIINAIVFRRFGTFEYSSLTPQSVLRNEMDNMVYNQCSDSDDDDEILYRNTPGVELLKDNRSNTKEIKKLKKDFTDMRKEIEELTQEKNVQNEHTASQSKDIEALKEASFGFEAVRHRWIDNFRRDELHLPGLGWRPVGNKVAHEADVVADARLWNLNQRNDQHVFVELYGFKPYTVDHLHKRGSWHALKVANKWADVRHAGKQTQLLRETYTHFRAVLAEEDWSDEACDNYTPLGGAYWDFSRAVPKA